MFFFPVCTPHQFIFCLSLGAEVFVVDVVDVDGAAFGCAARGRLVASDLFLLLATLFAPLGASVFKPNLKKKNPLLVILPQSSFK